MDLKVWVGLLVAGNDRRIPLIVVSIAALIKFRLTATGVQHFGDSACDHLHDHAAGDRRGGTHGQAAPRQQNAGIALYAAIVNH